jgi:hypothetical protein
MHASTTYGDFICEYNVNLWLLKFHNKERSFPFCDFEVNEKLPVPIAQQHYHSHLHIPAAVQTPFWNTRLNVVVLFAVSNLARQ